MVSGGEGDSLLDYLQLVVILITMGLIPYMISRNTKQHSDAAKDREETKKDIKDLKNDIKVVQSYQADMKITFTNDINHIKDEIVELKEERIEDLKMFFKDLYYRKDVDNG